MALPTVEELLEKDIFQLLEIEGADEATKKQIFQTMLNTVNARAINRVASLLTEKEAEEFKELAERGDPPKLQHWLDEREIDLPKIITEEAIRYRTEIVSLISSADKK